MVTLTDQQIRRLGTLAIVGGIIGLAYWPFYAAAFFATPSGADSADPAWVQAWYVPFRAVADPLLTFADEHTVYVTWGKALNLTMMGWLAGLVALHAWQQRGGAGRFERATYRFALVATGLLAAASVFLYWMPQPYWDAYVDYAFMGLAIPGFLLSMIAYPLYGWATLRARVARRAVGWALVLAAFPGIIVLTTLTGSLAGGLAGMSATWILAGVALRRGIAPRPADGADVAAGAEGS